MVSPKNNKPVLWPVIIVWIIVAVLCIQGYLFLSKRPKAVVPPQKPAVVKPAKPKAAAGGIIAVVLDDWGYNRSHCKQLSSFQAPVAVAILPGLPYSKDILQCARAAGKEAMLHLPVEPQVLREKYPRGYFLTTEMSQREVKKILQKTLDDFPGIVGANNHEGSKGTENSELMTTVLGELKRRGLFFVDSVTSAKTVGAEVAAKVKIPFARRNVFLDNRNDRESIERQFALAAKIAKEKGYVLVIGHDRIMTLQILSEQIPRLRRLGYQFLSIKQYIKAQQP